jgi:hypothetical protein
MPRGARNQRESGNNETILAEISRIHLSMNVGETNRPHVWIAFFLFEIRPARNGIQAKTIFDIEGWEPRPQPAGTQPIRPS